MTALLIGQEGPLTEGELNDLNNQKGLEVVRIYRKWISYTYGQKAAQLVNSDPSKLSLIQGELRGLAEAWGLPYKAGIILEQTKIEEKQQKQLRKTAYPRLQS